MRSFSLLAGLSLLAGTVLASPVDLPRRTTSTGKSVLYWGQNGGGVEENNDPGTYCNGTAGVDILILSFLYQYGNGVTVPGGLFGQTCQVLSNTGSAQGCDEVAAAVTTCQENGIQVFLSVGGSLGGYSLSSIEEAEAIGQYLWDAYGNGVNSSVTRPFGDAIVNGWDFDIENPDGSEYYPYLISTLRSNFETDKENTYYISGAPQCPIPEPNMGTMIEDSVFDYLWVQFYNNNNYTYPCALGINGDAAFNYDEWESFIATTNSSAAELFVGVPASPLGANGLESGSVYYATPEQLLPIIESVSSNYSNFGGIMMWAAGFSDNNVNDGCTFAQEAETILRLGEVCSGSFTATASLAPVVPTPTSGLSATATASATGTPVAAWGQV
ncbi:Endochitinase 2 [Talaromyces atroroseus]|uniref:Endochitinase 2 n=1 Tax=Talaromyces atroroseus TaxID=1441469 RepID=A0A225AMP4_TALAT|nr:Endochitinase 2 [Talaromyces atroroseus]OKL58538.1 Endochitinase 2 [Talaromyces atroroseus]